MVQALDSTAKILSTDPYSIFKTPIELQFNTATLRLTGLKHNVNEEKDIIDERNQKGK